MIEKKEIAAKIAGRFGYVTSNMLSDPAFSMRYIKYRISRPMLKLYTKFLNRKYRPSPWLSPTSIAIFDAVLDKNMIGLEYGSGSSTLFFAPRLRQLESIEHHEGWYHKVQDMMNQAGLKNVNLHLVKKEFGNSYAPFELDPADLRVKHWYANYFNKVLDYPDKHFDFVLIDGRARVECLLRSISKLKSGGILSLDNSERTRYQPVFRILEQWDRVDTTNGLTDTTIWFKP